MSHSYFDITRGFAQGHLGTKKKPKPCAQISPNNAIASGGAESECPGEEKFKQPFYQDDCLVYLFYGDSGLFWDLSLL